MTLPFHSETGRLRHRHRSGPEAQTSALSWSVTPALRSRSLESSDVMPPRTGHSTRRLAEGLRQASSEGGVQGEGAAGAANGTSAPSQGWCQPHTTACQNGEGQEGGCTRSRFPPPHPPSMETKLCLSILSPHLGKPGVAMPSASSHTPPQLCAIKFFLQKQ